VASFEGEEELGEERPSGVLGKTDNQRAKWLPPGVDWTL